MSCDAQCVHLVSSFICTVDFSYFFALTFCYHESYERAHISFGIEEGMDRIVVTKPGEKLPNLGEALHEDPESIKMRKTIGSGSVDWNLEDTYTMAFWSAYVHYIDVSRITLLDGSHLLLVIF